jgi:2-polyprenyl-3-methyl-5-hydroxy-6-metoxy-1,4-benzoquinol methylase
VRDSSGLTEGSPLNCSSEYFQKTRPEIVPLLPSRYSRVLEIGCGEGRFRDNLTQEHEYWGVEPAEPVANVASTRADRVLVGDYQEVIGQIPDDYFDLVICNDVIEHMSDPDGFLQSIQSKMIHDGYLVASIPNVRYLGNLFELLIRKDWEYKNSGVLDRTHLRFFTKKSIERTLVGNGFLIDQLDGINPVPARSLESLVMRGVFVSAVLLFGQDAKFLQFGVRAKRAHL